MKEDLAELRGSIQDEEKAKNLDQTITDTESLTSTHRPNTFNTLPVIDARNK